MSQRAQDELGFESQIQSFASSSIHRLSCVTLVGQIYLDFLSGPQEAGQVVWYSHLLEFSIVYCDPHSQGFGIINKAEIYVFMELSCFFNDPADVGNLISGSSAFSKTSLNIWNFMVHILLKPGLENFKLYLS